MVKVLLPLLSLFALSALQTSGAEDFRDHLRTEENGRGNYTLTSVDSFSKNNEFRVYHYDDMVIDEVASGAFEHTSFETLVLTRSVIQISDVTFEKAENIKNLFFTGSEAEFKALNLTHDFQLVKYYAVDEGFINYWNDVIRPTKETNICEISKETYSEVYNMYKALSNDDFAVVDSYVDCSDAKISDSMKELIHHFQEDEPAQQNDEWNQTGAITLITFIAILGMTFISIFYLFKTKHIIN